MYKITNQKIFNAKVVDLDIEIHTFTNYEMTSFKGTVSIETNEGRLDINGEHGLNDYKDLYGFTINNQ
jgi:hypothetical protein